MPSLGKDKPPAKKTKAGEKAKAAGVPPSSRTTAVADPPPPPPAHEGIVAKFLGCVNPAEVAREQAHLRRDLRRGLVSFPDAKKASDAIQASAAGQSVKDMIRKVIGEVKDGGPVAKGPSTKEERVLAHRTNLVQAKAGYLNDRKLLTCIYEVLVDLFEGK